MNSQKIINLLTICRKSGNLVIGFDAARNTFSEKKVCCILTAKDISANTLKKITAVCDSYTEKKIPLLRLDITVDELEIHLGQKMAVASVCNEGFAKRLAELNENICSE